MCKIEKKNHRYRKDPINR